MANNDTNLDHNDERPNKRKARYEIRPSVTVPRQFRRLAFVAAVSFLVVAIVLILAAISKTRDTTMVVHARSETIAFRVVDSEASQIPITNAIYDGAEIGDPRSGDCLIGHLFPRQDSVIRYRRGSDGRTAIILEDIGSTQSGALFVQQSGDDIVLPAGTALIFNSDNLTCPSPSSVRFPILGPIDLGERLSVMSRPSGEPGLLIEGHLVVYGRGAKLVPPLPSEPDLYEAGDVSLPTGSRLVSLDEGENALRGSIWQGIVRGGEGEAATGVGFIVDIAASAESISLYPPGTLSGPDRISVTFFARLFRDPNVLRSQVYLAVLFLALQTFAALAQIVEINPTMSSREDEKD